MEAPGMSPASAIARKPDPRVHTERYACYKHFDANQRKCCYPVRDAENTLSIPDPRVANP
jgi:hypothetical protein